MHFEDGTNEISGSTVDAGGRGDGRPRLSRRQALGRMSAVAGAGATAWVVPEILAARPAAAAVSSPGGGHGDPDGDGDTDGNGRGDGDGDGGGRGHNAMSSAGGAPAGQTLATVSPASMFSLSRPGIVRDAELGAAMVAGGWVFHRWMSRGSEGPECAEAHDIDPV